MNKPKSVAKNYIYNLIYQIFLIITPLITTPYVSRVLGADGIGRFSFSNSIVSYFALFAALGFGYYAQREIARFQGDKPAQTQMFLEILLVRACSVITVLLIYLTVLSLGIFEAKYVVLLNILSVAIITIAFDFTFMLAGNEDFAQTVLINVIIKIFSITSIFIFVKQQDDLWKYVLINVLVGLISNIALVFYLPNYLCRIDLKQLKPLRHIKPALILFVPTIAISVYAYLDKTMIGIITGSDFETGYYEQGEKLVKMVLTIVTSLGVVMVPKNSNAFQRKDMEAIKYNIYRSLQFVMFLAIPMTIGIIAVADNVVPWFLGDGYLKSATVIKVLSPLIFVIGLSNIFGIQYLIPSGQDKKFTLAVVCGAVTNFVLNMFLIALFKSIGAAISTILAETVVTVVMYCFVRKNISFIKSIKLSFKYLISGSIMGFLCIGIGFVLRPSIANTFIIVLIGVVSYLTCLILLKDAFFTDLLRQFFKKIHIKFGK